MKSWKQIVRMRRKKNQKQKSMNNSLIKMLAQMTFLFKYDGNIRENTNLDTWDRYRWHE